jgi:hypothetical protein
MIVSDMAWHYDGGKPPAWAGYAWSPELFPAPQLFKAWVEARRMNFTLNLHLDRVQPPPITPHELWDPFVRRSLPPPHLHSSFI